MTCLLVGAHGPENEQVTQLTAHLGRHPEDLTARLKRAELLWDHARDGDAQALAGAREDFATVLRTRPELGPAQLGMARVELLAGEATNALRRLDQVLQGRGPHAAAVHVLRASALMQCRRPAEAAEAYTTAISLQDNPRPDVFLSRARAQLAANPTNTAIALAGLDAGLQRLGPVPGLQLLALDICLRARDHDGALRRLDDLARESDRQESWLSRRGDILWDAGRPIPAREAWQAAQAACRQLPDRLRATPVLRELEEDLARKLATRLAPSPPVPQAPVKP